MVADQVQVNLSARLTRVRASARPESARLAAELQSARRQVLRRRLVDHAAHARAARVEDEVELLREQRLRLARAALHHLHRLLPVVCFTRVLKCALK